MEYPPITLVDSNLTTYKLPQNTILTNCILGASEHNQQPQPTVSNELAKERNRAAAERTITGWIQSSLTLIGFGLAVDQFIPALNQRFPQQEPAFTAQLARTIGLSFVGMSIVLLIVALMQHWIEVKSIERHDYVILPSHPLNFLVFSAVLIFALLAVISILLIPE